VQITYSPSIGMILALAGCIAAAVAALNTVPVIHSSRSLT
jgi:hypothetical protein